MIILKPEITLTLLILFVMLFAFTCVSYAGVGDVLVNSADTLYHDGKAVVDSVYHDGKAVVSTVYQDAKAGATTIYPDVKAAVVSIGKAIGVAAEHVYGVLVKKYFVLGVKEACIELTLSGLPFIHDTRSSEDIGRRRVLMPWSAML